MNRIISLILVCMLTLAVVVGCGSGAKKGPSVKWSGTVTIEGQPLPSNAQGQILVRSNTGSGAGDQADIVNGSYSLQNVPKGEVTVSFNIFTTSPSKDPMDADRGVEETTNIVPDQWLQGVATVADKNDSAKNFDLTK